MYTQREQIERQWRKKQRRCKKDQVRSTRAVAALETVKVDIVAKYVAMAGRDEAAYTESNRRRAWEWEQKRKTIEAREIAEATRVELRQWNFEGTWRNSQQPVE